MGLDITAYKLLGLVENPKLDEDGYPVNDEKEVKLWKHPDFPKQFDDLIDKGVYKFEYLDGFRAGSYMSYTQYREKLAEIAGYRPFIDPCDASSTHLPFFYGAHKVISGVFHEQIVFSDCEGFIGSKTSKKLADDYAKCLDEAQKEGGRFFEIYLSFKNAFELAANNGVVRFH